MVLAFLSQPCFFIGHSIINRQTHIDRFLVDSFHDDQSLFFKAGNTTLFKIESLEHLKMVITPKSILIQVEKKQ